MDDDRGVIYEVVEIDAIFSGIFNRLKIALEGSNLDQQRIAEIGLEWLCLLLSKNLDYGGSVWEEPVLAPFLSPGDAILVRMSDKIKRLRNLLGSDGPGETDESVEDTMSDLGAYCLLWLARPKGE